LSESYPKVFVLTSQAVFGERNALCATKVSNKPFFLVVDDQREIGEMIETMLVAFGADCDLVTDGFSAVKCVQEKDYDGALIDIQLPLMDGMNTARVLQIIDDDLKVVMMTAGSTKPGEVSDRGVNLFHFLPKPFTADDIKGIIDRIGKSNRLNIL
jgi:DNA-binding NtrC family response regulator